MANFYRQAPANFENLFIYNHFADEENEESPEDCKGANKIPSCWVFGYGSLCWHPGFEYSKCITGYIRGYVRRFWQGNVTHRGTKEKPGRVATLVTEKDGITWGCAFRITGDTALEYLKQRECTLGGYITIDTKFFPRVASHDAAFIGEAFEVLAYVATEQNPHWLGNDLSENIAQQIIDSSGPSGHNIEYLLRLCNFMREEIPDATDEHLFHLEGLVRHLMTKHKIPSWTVMGDDPTTIRRDSHEETKRTLSFEFSSRIAERKLRCLNI